VPFDIVYIYIYIYIYMYGLLSAGESTLLLLCLIIAFVVHFFISYLRFWTLFTMYFTEMVKSSPILRNLFQQLKIAIFLLLQLVKFLEILKKAEHYGFVAVRLV
jgi:hypothetical protein